MGRRGPTKHEFETLTDFCVRCGCSRKDFVDGFRPTCDEVGNSVGISHLVILRKWQGPISEICKELIAIESSTAKA